MPGEYVVIVAVVCYLFGYFMGWLFGGISRKLKEFSEKDCPAIEPAKTYEEIIRREG